MVENTEVNLDNAFMRNNIDWRFWNGGKKDVDERTEQMAFKP